MRYAPIVLTFVLAQAASAQSPAPYSITHTYTLGGAGFWDYVVPDPPSHRLYIARQTRVMVVDADTGKLVGEVTGINGAHGTAIVADTGHGFATSSEDKSVVMFGSHNWSNEGVKTNRDASLIFKDKEIAEYLAEVYDYDWTTLATAHPAKSRPRVARDGEATPAGFARVPASSVMEEDG